MPNEETCKCDCNVLKVSENCNDPHYVETNGCYCACNYDRLEQVCQSQNKPFNNDKCDCTCDVEKETENCHEKGEAYKLQESSCKCYCDESIPCENPDYIRVEEEDTCNCKCDEEKLRSRCQELQDPNTVLCLCVPPFDGTEYPPGESTANDPATITISNSTPAPGTTTQETTIQESTSLASSPYGSTPSPNNPTNSPPGNAC